MVHVSSIGLVDFWWQMDGVEPPRREIVRGLKLQGKFLRAAQDQRGSTADPSGFGHERGRVGFRDWPAGACRPSITPMDGLRHSRLRIAAVAVLLARERRQ